MIKFSFIIPVYNSCLYLRECVDSLLNQTYKNIEIILIDDGSTDGSGELCDFYKNKDERVVTFHKRNGGVSSARNTGLNICTGDYVAFVDSDDWIDKNACKEILNQIDNNTMLYMFSLKKIVDGKEKIQPPIYKEETFLGMVADIISGSRYQNYYIRAVWSKIYSRKILNGVLFPENMYIGEDACFVLEVMLKIGNMDQIKVCIGNWYNYRIISTSAVRKYKMDMLEQSYFQFDYIRKLLSKVNVENNITIKTAMTMLSWNIYIGLIDNCLKKDSFHKDCNSWIDFSKSEIKEMHIEIKRMSKFQFFCWISYIALGEKFVEHVVRCKLKKQSVHK